MSIIASSLRSALCVPGWDEPGYLSSGGGGSTMSDSTSTSASSHAPTNVSAAADLPSCLFLKLPKAALPRDIEPDSLVYDQFVVHFAIWVEHDWVENSENQMVNEAARAVGHVLRMKVGSKGILAGKDCMRLWDEAELLRCVWTPSAELNILMFMVATDIEISNLGNARWPKWANISNSDISRQPDHEWLKPSSSTRHVLMDSDTPSEDNDDHDDYQSGIGYHGKGDDHQSGIGYHSKGDDNTGKGKQKAQVDTDDNMQPATTPKGIQSMDATPASMEEGQSKMSMVPMHVRPLGPGKIKKSTTGDKVKPVTMSDDRQWKGNTNIEDTIARDERKEGRKGRNASSKSHAQSQIRGTTDSAQITEDEENVANDLCSWCQEKAFVCIIGRNTACKMCHRSKVRCSHIQQQPPQRARSVGRRDQPKGSKQPTKTSTWKRRQESPPPPSTTTDSADQSNEVSPPPPKRQHRRASESWRQPSVAPTQQVLVHPGQRTAKGVTACHQPSMPGLQKVKAPHIVPHSTPPPPPLSSSSITIGDPSFADAYNMLRKDNAQLRSRIDMVESSMTALGEEVKRLREGGHPQLRFPFDNRDVSQSDSNEVEAALHTTRTHSVEEPVAASNLADAANDIGPATPAGTPTTTAMQYTPQRFSVLHQQPESLTPAGKLTHSVEDNPDAVCNHDDTTDNISGLGTPPGTPPATAAQTAPLDSLTP
ncbi:hypothetical protein V8E55_006992 [Tylopilus felleus]